MEKPPVIDGDLKYVATELTDKHSKGGAMEQKCSMINKRQDIQYAPF